MAESMQGLHRTHRCTELSVKNIGETVTVMGWVQKSRNKGGIIFVDLRDRSGILQLIFEEADCGAEHFSKAERLRSEFVIAVVGKLTARSGAVNQNLETGEIEVRVSEFRILSEAQTPPFPIESDSKTKEEMRLRYRFLDLRRPDIQRKLMLRSQVATKVRAVLAEEGFLDRYGVRLLGTSPEGIRDAEDRQCFKDMMEKINEPCIASKVVHTVEDAINFGREIGLPVIIRPAYTLGGTGGGIAYTLEELEEIAGSGIRMSRVNEILVEKCISGWKEIEYEVMRDSKGNCITICNMENIDPVGIHTGDSIVVAPSQTLSNREYQMLRTSAIKIISALKIEGGCNVQFALNPHSFEYAVIEVNPRVSRSSALASKATGYPIAKVATKIALRIYFR